MKNDSHETQFSIGDAKFTHVFRTQGSVSFNVHVDRMPGWVDIHFPCKEDIKVQVRAALPEEALQPKKVVSLIRGLLEHLGIEKDTSYEVLCFRPTKMIGFGEPTKIPGRITEFVSTQKYKIRSRDS